MLENVIIGTLAMAFGASMLIESIFGVRLPVVRVTLGLLIIFWGIYLIFLNQ